MANDMSTWGGRGGSSILGSACERNEALKGQSRALALTVNCIMPFQLSGAVAMPVTQHARL